MTQLHKKNLIKTAPIDEEKVKVIANGVNIQKFSHSFKPIPSETETLSIGVLSRLDPKKGQDVALAALKILVAKTQRKWSLHLIGEDTPGEKSIRPQLDLLVDQWKLSDIVFFDGFVFDVQDRMQSFDLLWMPSQCETFGRCIIEAMASGVPVVASAAGGVPDIIDHGKNGILFEALNAEDLAQKTLELVQQPERFLSIQRTARKTTELLYDQAKIWPELLGAVRPTQMIEKKLESY